MSKSPSTKAAERHAALHPRGTKVVGVLAVSRLEDGAKPRENQVPGHKRNFETLQKAFASGDMCLLDCRLKATGERVAALCVVQQNHTDSDRAFIPFAIMLNGNPYELLDPPDVIDKTAIEEDMP